MNPTTIIIGARQVLKLSDIVCMRADVNYTHIFMEDGKKMIVATTLKELEYRFLPFPKFFRIHKSMIINIDCIKQIDDTQVVLQNGEVFTPACRRRKAFLKVINA